MKKVKILFPQIIFEAKVIELSDADIEQIEVYGEAEIAQLLWDNMDDQEKQWTQGKKWMEDLVDHECIKPIPKK